MRELDEDGVKDYLRKHVAALGSQKEFAQRADISEQYLSDVLKGVRPVGDRILLALNFERVVTFRKRIN